MAASAYNIDWNKKPQNIKKAIILIIMRSQKPVGITAAKFYYINLQTFASVLSTSLSYFMLLRKVMDME